MSEDPGARVAVGGNVFHCLVCQGGTFREREIRMNTAGMSMLNLDWLNKAAVGVICTTCGFVHMFAGGDLRWDRP